MPQLTRPPAFVWVVALGMCAVWIAFGSRTLAAARAHDFLNIYTGASLALDGRFADLHETTVQLERERRYVPVQSLVPFVRPAFYAAILAPLALFPYNMAFAIWIVIQSLLLLACWTWAWRRFGPEALVFGTLFLPPPLGIATGQDCAVLLAIFIISYELIDSNRPVAGGAALALLLIKFHLVMLWPVALLLQRRWRILAGFSAMAALEIIASLALGGPHGAELYVALLRNKSLDRLSPSPELMISYQGLAANLDITAPWAIGAILFAIVAIFLFAVTRAPLWRTFCLTALASLLIVPHVYAYDATLLLLPVWLTIFKSVHAPSRIAATLFSTPIPFGFALADKPWAVISSASMLLLFVMLSTEPRAPASGS
jgi:hypothetical protein